MGTTIDRPPKILGMSERGSWGGLDHEAMPIATAARTMKNTPCMGSGSDERPTLLLGVLHGRFDFLTRMAWPRYAGNRSKNGSIKSISLSRSATELGKRHHGF